MAEWKKIITSGSIAELAQITASTGISATSIKDVTTFEAGGDLDIGAHEFRAETFESDVSTGTAPFTVASTTAVSNLNADLLDGQHGSHYLDFGNFVIDDSEIPLDKLAQDAITIAGTSTQLGGSITAAAILNLCAALPPSKAFKATCALSHKVLLANALCGKLSTPSSPPCTGSVVSS